MVVGRVETEGPPPRQESGQAEGGLYEEKAKADTRRRDRRVLRR
jgi:hypothetical protein